MEMNSPVGSNALDAGSQGIVRVLVGGVAVGLLTRQQLLSDR